MTTTLATINALVNDRRRDTTALSVDMTAEGFRAINGTLQTWNQEHDWPWQLESTLIQYNDRITRYNIPTSWDFKALVNIRPYKPTQVADDLYYVGQTKFDGDTTHAHRCAVEIKGQAQILRCKYQGWSQDIDAMSSYNSNGTWVGATAISAVATDLYDSFEQPSSISFNYSGTSGTLTNSTLTAMDLSRYVGRSNFFVNFNMQSVANFTGITLKIGSSASNYITIAATTDYLGNTPTIGFNKFGFAWSGTTTVVGTPVYTAITYAQITITYSSNPSTIQNNLENLFVTENVPMTVDYYSNNMVVDTTGAKTQIFTDATHTTDTPMWTGTWDFVNEPFITSCMETVSYLTGEQNDEADAFAKAGKHLEPLKARLPSKRRYPQFQMSPDVNGPYAGSQPYPYRRYYP